MTTISWIPVLHQTLCVLSPSLLTIRGLSLIPAKVPFPGSFPGAVRLICLRVPSSLTGAWDELCSDSWELGERPKSVFWEAVCYSILCQ